VLDEKAKAAADSWLLLNDHGKYEHSWDAASTFFQHGIEKTSWVIAAKNARSPLGMVKNRSLKSASFTHSLPETPEGEYLVIQYKSQFENKTMAIETITSMREKDGSWKIAGYYIY